MYCFIKCTNLFSVNLDVSDVVLKNCWNVDFRKLVFTENYEKTCFPTCSIPDYHQFLPNGCHLCWETREGFLQGFVTENQTELPKLSAVPQKEKETILSLREMSTVVLNKWAKQQSHTSSACVSYTTDS